MLVVDANALIAAASPGHVHHRAALAALGSDPSLATPALTAAEFLVLPAAQGKLVQAQARLDTLGIRTHAFGPQDVSPLAMLRAATGLRMPDAVVLLLAHQLECPLVTFDQRLAAKARADGVLVLQGARPPDEGAVRTTNA